MQIEPWSKCEVYVENRIYHLMGPTNEVAEEKS